jgi:hypothetical protein
MELQVVAAAVLDEVSLFNDRSLRSTAPSSAPALAPRIETEATTPEHNGFARHSRESGHRSPSERWGSESAPTRRPLLKEEVSIQALTVPVELVDRGDVLAIGQRFYRVDAVAQMHAREFPLIVLRSLETAARAAIEFRNSDALVSVLRFPTMPWWAGEAALNQQAPLGQTASRLS